MVLAGGCERHALARSGTIAGFPYGTEGGHSGCSGIAYASIIVTTDGGLLVRCPDGRLLLVSGGFLLPSVDKLAFSNACWVGGLDGVLWACFECLGLWCLIAYQSFGFGVK